MISFAVSILQIKLTDRKFGKTSRFLRKQSFHLHHCHPKRLQHNHIPIRRSLCRRVLPRIYIYKLHNAVSGFGGQHNGSVCIMFIDQQYIFFGCLILFFFILGVIIFVNKDKKSMEPKRKLEIDPVFTLIVVDSNAYQTHKQRISKLESGKFSREVFIKEMTEELLNGLAASTSKKTQDKYFTLKKMFLVFI